MYTVHVYYTQNHIESALYYTVSKHEFVFVHNLKIYNAQTSL